MPNSNIRIVVDRNIPFVKGLLDPYATVRYLAPEEITSRLLREVDGMMIRTRNKCSAELLDKSAVKLITTATIGTDHIDLDYCSRRGITVVNAPGCNAPAVAQYVFASVLNLINRPLPQYTIGVVGVGHVGSIVAQWAKEFDMKVLLCDPFREEAEGGDGWCSLETIARQADIITFHTPLTKDGPHPTYHLAGEEFFAQCRRTPIIINSSRGSVVDTPALVAAAKAGKTGPLVIDCWEGEPAIDRELLGLASVATPHIAGYSREGKIRASQIAIDAITTFFMLPRVTITGEALPPAPAQCVSKNDVLASYNPMPETAALKARPEDFEAMRNNYNLRHEVPEGHDRY